MVMLYGRVLFTNKLTDLSVPVNDYFQTIGTWNSRALVNPSISYGYKNWIHCSVQKGPLTYHMGIT